jgi:hypothetical protein
MSSIIDLAIVDDNIDPKGIGRIRVKLTGEPTGPIEKSADYEPWGLNDPFIANPFLPTNINYIPQKGQTVKIITYDPDNKLINREYIAGPFTTVHDFQSQINARQVENTTYGTSVKTMNDIFNSNGDYVEKKSKGTLSTLKDYAIYGPYGSDVLLTENGITLRGGKLLSKQGASDKERSKIIEYPLLAEKRSILSLKKFGTKQQFVDVETEVITLPSKKLSYVIEYNVSSTNTSDSSFTISWYIYEVKDILGDTFNTRVFGSNSVQDLSSYADKVKLINEDRTLTTPTFTQTVGSYELAYVTIRNTICELHSEGVKKFNSKIPKLNLHPFFYRPVRTLTDKTFLTKITPGCLNTPTYGSGLVFSLLEPTPKPKGEKKKEKILKTVSTTIEQSFGTLSSDKIYFISTDANTVGTKKIPFDKLDTYEYTQEDLLTKIEPNTYSSVRGETLIEYLDILTRVIAGHAHQPTKPMVKNGYPDWDRLMELRKTLENDILNKSIRIN